MRLGILTFHSQLNYGGVLQCWALQTALEKMGHKVVVLDLWRTPGNRALLGPFGSLSFKQWLKLIARSLLKGSRDFSAAVRHWRTIRFVRSKLHLTPFHFYEWKDVKSPLGVDCIVVGSDQVWHCGNWGDPRPFLLEGAPPVPAIAYAASFGMNEIPRHIQIRFPDAQNIEAFPVYKHGLSRFSAIGCRELEGTGLCTALGFRAEHVCDPTLLRSSPMSSLGPPKKSERARKRLLCYFLKEDIPSKIDLLNTWTKRSEWTVDVFGPGDIPWHRACSGIRIGTSLKLKVSAGPLQFLKALHEADACVSDSFHAFALSLLFDINVRLLKPSSSAQKEMASRVVEFANAFCEGSVFTDSLPEALDGIEHEIPNNVRFSSLDDFRNHSEAWLASKLEAIP